MSTRASTTRSVVQATIVDQLQGRGDLDGVQVVDGDTGQADAENLVLSGTAHWDDESWAALGARSRQETYTLDGFCQVVKQGLTAREARERADEIVGVVELALRDMAGVPGMAFGPALAAAFGTGKAQVTNLEFRPTKGLDWILDEGHGHQVDFLIRVTARI